MKLAHLSDLHLGIDFGPYSLKEDQEYILKKIINIIEEEKTDGVIIAGDVYDKGIASVEAIKMLETFLSDLLEKGQKIFIISGNHDTAERLSFGREFMKGSGIYFSKVYDGTIEPVVLEDKYGPVNFYLMPFVKPSAVRFYNPDTEITGFDDAIGTVIENLKLDTSKRNICVAHQNIINAEHCDSEMPVYGGLDGIAADRFDVFDYTALGHIHGPQSLGKNKTVRYCGTPLKYSLSEKNHKKSVTIIDLQEKGKVAVTTRELEPLRNVREEIGTFDEIYQRNKNTPKTADDFVAVTLKDEDEVKEAYVQLKTVLPHILYLNYDNTRTRNTNQISDINAEKIERPADLFDLFYSNRNGLPMDEEQKEYITGLIADIWGEE